MSRILRQWKYHRAGRMLFFYVQGTQETAPRARSAPRAGC
jgi:hypothetical protein